jgi:tartrate-resistant acid phosphatase type 5
MIRSTVIFYLVLVSFTRVYSQSVKQNATEPTLTKKSINFLVISDWGRDGMKDINKKTPGQLKVAKQLGVTAKKNHALFIVTCGDNFHDGGVKSLTDPFWKVNYENVYTAKSLMIPWYITLGNHDYEGNVEAELEYAKTSKRWIQPSRYFTFLKTLYNSTSVLFVILDSSPFVQSYCNDGMDKHHVKGQDTTAQVRWCDSVFNVSKAKWKLVFFHHPAYSASSTHGSTIEIQNTFVPLFEKYHVDACFSGHDHDLQHSHPENSTIEYFGCGGGSETRPAGKSSFTKFSEASLGFGVVSMTQNTMKFSFVNEQGLQIYTYDIYK